MGEGEPGVIEWRFGGGWTEAELERRLERLKRFGRNFREAWDEMVPERGWNHYRSQAVVAREPPGEPLAEGAFQRARMAIENYEFSDPSIVEVHFDPRDPLVGRHVLIEIKVLGLHYLCGVRVAEVREEADADGGTVYGFRYDTVGDHIEQGSEWFLLRKDHATGEIRFRVDARWRPGQFPNWWSRVGFMILSPRYHRIWHHAAQRRIAFLARESALAVPIPPRGRLVHEGPDVAYETVLGARRRRER